MGLPGERISRSSGWLPSLRYKVSRRYMSTGRVFNVEEFLCGVFHAGVIITVLVEALARFTGVVLPVTDEFARYLLAWIAFIGMAAATNAESHIGITLLDSYLSRRSPPLWQRVLIARRCIELVIYLFLFYLGIKITTLQFTLHRTWDSVSLPIFVIYLCLPLGSLLGAFRIVQKTTTLIRYWIK